MQFISGRRYGRPRSRTDQSRAAATASRLPAGARVLHELTGRLSANLRSRDPDRADDMRGS